MPSPQTIVTHRARCESSRSSLKWTALKHRSHPTDYSLLNRHIGITLQVAVRQHSCRLPKLSHNTVLIETFLEVLILEFYKHSRWNRTRDGIKKKYNNYRLP